MPIPSKKLGFTFNHADQVDNYGQALGDSAVLKANFDSRAEELRLAHNELLDYLTSDEGKGTKLARFVVGTTQAGWGAGDCQYLCDGVDDNVQIQAAVDALPEEGGVIVLLDGEYSISSTVRLKSNTTILGNGVVTVLRLAAPTETDTEYEKQVFLGESVANVHIANMKIVFDIGETPPELQVLAQGVCIDDSERVSITHIAFVTHPLLGHSFACIDCLRANDVVIADNHLNGESPHILAGDGNRISILRNTITQAQGQETWYNKAGIAVGRATNCVIQGNHLDNAVISTTCAGPQSDSYYIVGNICNGNENADGIFISAAEPQTNLFYLVGNTCNRNYGSGISASFSGEQRNIFIAHNNACSNNGRNGIAINCAGENDNKLQIMSNICNNNAQAGVMISVAAGLLLGDTVYDVSHNICMHNHMFGIVVFVAVTLVHLILPPPTPSISLVGNICSNTKMFHDTSGAGIMVSLMCDSRLGACITIADCTCNSNAGSGIAVQMHAVEQDIEDETLEGSVVANISGCSAFGNDIGIIVIGEPTTSGPRESCVISNNIIRRLHGQAPFRDMPGSLCVQFVNASVISGNICLKGSGQPSDYGEDDATIFLMDVTNSIVSLNSILGKDVTVVGGSGNTIENNKY